MTLHRVSGDAAEAQPRALLTVGHGKASAGQLTQLLLAAGVELLVDIRRFPASRANPHLARETLAELLRENRVAYRWEERLGGRRRLDKTVESPDSWWTVEAFRAYAAYTRSPEFNVALDGLLDDLDRCAVAVMCSESVWWRCHRRLVADVTVLARGRDVAHLMPNGKQVSHRPAEGARLRGDGLLVWDDRHDPSGHPQSPRLES